MKKAASTLKRLLLVLLLGIVGSQFIQPNFSHADTLSVIPPRFELFGNPGDSVVDKIKVRNGSNSTISYQVVTEDFKAAGEEGGIALIDPGTPNTSFSLASWITVEPSRLTLAPGEEQSVSFTIRIPRTGEPGGHYASVLISRAGQEAAGSTAVDTRVGSLILLRVSGAVTEKAQIDTFRTLDSFAQHGPVTFQLRTANQGNVHVQPTGTIVITNMFGKKVAEVPVTPANVLPGSSRNVNIVWNEKNPIGRYTATLVATYGQSKQTLSASTSFIVFPLWLLGLIIVIAVGILLFFTQRKKFKRLINRLTSD